ncbi:MAG: FGGY family carbohydrate kinase [Synergistaceae bacterium]
MANYYVAFDCGTMGTKTAIYRDDSTMIVSAYRENKIYYPLPGRAEMDPMGFVNAVREGVRECIEKSSINPADIRAMSASGIICGIVAIDKNWKPVTPFVSYLDNRARCESEWVKANVEAVWEEESGNTTVDEFMPPLILRWFLNRYEGFKDKAVKVLNNGPFVLGTLAGLKSDSAFIDWATVSGWLIGYSAKEKKWSKKQLDALGIPIEILPKIIKPWDIVGYLCPKESELMGLPSGIPIVAGAGDTMQSALASGLMKPGQSTDVAGTASIFAVAVPDIVKKISQTPGMMFASGTLENSYFYWSMIRAGGLSLRWFRDSVAEKSTDANFYSAMDLLATKIPAGSNGVLFYPYLQGGGPNLPGACGSFLGLYGSSNNAVMWRSLLESIAYEYLQMVKIYRENNISITEVIGTEGGSKSPLWNQIKSDILGVEYNIPTRNEGGLMADAAVAAYGVGDIKDLKQTMIDWTTYKERYNSNLENNALYEKIYIEREKMLMKSMKDVFCALEKIRSFR